MSGTVSKHRALASFANGYRVAGASLLLPLQCKMRVLPVLLLLLASVVALYARQDGPISRIGNNMYIQAPGNGTVYVNGEEVVYKRELSEALLKNQASEAKINALVVAMNSSASSYDALASSLQALEDANTAALIQGLDNRIQAIEDANTAALIQGLGNRVKAIEDGNTAALIKGLDDRLKAVESKLPASSSALSYIVESADCLSADPKTSGSCPKNGAFNRVEIFCAAGSVRIYSHWNGQGSNCVLSGTGTKNRCNSAASGTTTSNIAVTVLRKCNCPHHPYTVRLFASSDSSRSCLR